MLSNDMRERMLETQAAADRRLEEEANRMGTWSEMARDQQGRRRIDMIEAQLHRMMEQSKGSKTRITQATDAFLDEQGVWVELDEGMKIRLRLTPELMRKVAGLIQMYDLAKLVPAAADEPSQTTGSPVPSR